MLVKMLFISLCLSCYYLLFSCHAIESPQFIVVHSEPEFEIRLYAESSWISASVLGASSLEKATKDGFHRLYQYMHGANANSSQLNKTAPILTSIIPSSPRGSGSPDYYFVRSYIPAVKFEGAPVPLPELNLQLGKWGSQCVAVRKFSGFAGDNTVNKEVDALESSINKVLQQVGNPSSSNNIAASTASSSSSSYVKVHGYSVAQYNAPFRLVGRLNEVWVNVSGVTIEGCP